MFTFQTCCLHIYLNIKFNNNCICIYLLHVGRVTWLILRRLFECKWSVNRFFMVFFTLCCLVKSVKIVRFCAVFWKQFCSLIGFFLFISGRILNRFAKDIGHLDSLLPWTFVDFIQVCFAVFQCSEHHIISTCWRGCIRTPITCGHMHYSLW